MEKHYFNTYNHIGLNGLSMAMDFNDYCDSHDINYHASWNTDISRIKKNIINMLDNSIPCVLAIGPNYFSDKGIDFYDIDNDNLFNPYDLTIKKMENKNDHYVTVTGLLEDNINGNCLLEISSYGYKYYINYSDYHDYVFERMDYIFSNILYIERTE